MSDLVASLDGGGTKTILAVADRSGTARIMARAGGCNPQDNPNWATQLDAALADLPETPPVAHLTLGLPGYGEVALMDAMLEHHLGRNPNQTLMNDVAMAAVGAFPVGGGVLILSGTGSMAMATGPNGQHRCGGWGDTFGDEGSGHAIGQAALQRASLMIDGRLADTGFATALAALLGAPATALPFGLLAWVLAQPHSRSGVASVAQHVDALARTGQGDALDILTTAAADLALQGQTAARAAGLGPAAPWAKAGSVFRSPIFNDLLAQQMTRAPVPPALPPLGGGLLLAAQAAGWSTGPNWTAHIATTLEKALT